MRRPTSREVLAGAGLAVAARWGGALVAGVVMVGGRPRWAARLLHGPPVES